MLTCYIVDASTEGLYARALAREFVTLDNFYVDAEVSYDGHVFSTGAYATDFIEKMWPTKTGAALIRTWAE